MWSQLFTNQWFGKAVGFTAAFIVAPADHTLLSIIVILGIGGGHLFDMWAARETPLRAKLKPSEGKAKSRTRPSPPHLEFLFAALGRIARQSGVVTKRQVALTESFIKDLGLDRSGRTQAIDWFNQGKARSYPLSQLAKQCRRTDKTAKRMRQITLKCMAQMTALNPSDQVLATTVSLAGLLNISPGDVANEFGQALEQNRPEKRPKERPSAQRSGRPSDAGGSTRQNTPAAKSDPSPRALACRVLGIDPTADIDEAKLAYRRLVSRHHPDKLGPKASKASINQAQQRMVELRDALETIQASVGA